jgi:tetratricopeptide (TPR) repeat protein
MITSILFQETGRSKMLFDRLLNPEKKISESIEKLLKRSDPLECLSLISDLLASKDYVNALKCSEKALKFFTDDHRVVLMHIDVLIELERFEEAESLLETVCKSEPDRMIYLIKNAYLNACIQKKEECHKWIEKARSLEPNNLEIHFWTALSFHKLGLNTEALEELLKISVETVNNKRKLYSIAELYQKLGKKDECLKALTRILEIDPKNHLCMHVMAKKHFENNDFKAAERLLKEACSHNNEVHEYHHLLGLVYSKTGNSEKALRHISTALFLNPSNSEYNYFMGIEYIKKKLYFHSKTFLERAIELTPEQPQYHEAYAISLMYCSDNPNSEKEFKKALKLNPGNPATYRNLGLLFQKQKKYKQARECYLKALEINPVFYEVLARLITVSDKTGLRIPERFHPDDARDHLFAAGVKMLKKEKFEEAFELFRLVLEIDPEYAEAHYILGETMCSHNCLKTAIYHLETAVSLDEDEYYIIALFDALKKAGQDERADKILRKLSNVYFKEGLEFIEEGCHQDALMRFKKALELNSGNTPAMYNTALVKQMLGQDREALEIYSSCLEKADLEKDRNFRKQIKERIQEINKKINQLPELVMDHKKNDISIQIKAGSLHQCDTPAVVIPVSARLSLRKGHSRFFKELYPELMTVLSISRPLRPGMIIDIEKNGQLLIFASISYGDELTSKEILLETYYNILALLKEKRISYISMPPLGTDMKWFNLEKSAHTFTEAIMNNRDSLKIDIVLRDNGMCKEMSAQLLKHL